MPSAPLPASSGRLSAHVISQEDVIESYAACGGGSYHEGCAAAIDSRRLCPPSNRIPITLLAGNPAMEVQTLVLEAVPKAGSTLLRDYIVPKISPDFRNKDQKHKGQENEWSSCASDQHRLSQNITCSGERRFII